MKTLLRNLVLFGLLSLLALSGLLGAQPVCDDVDWDLITDEEDNCMDIYNPAQADEDGDLIGDPCDGTTPQHDYRFARCYRTNWSGLTGPGWEDIKFSIYEPSERFFPGLLRWPDMMGDTLENGPGQHNGRDIWFMGQWIGVEYATATYIEGTSTEVDERNVVQHIEGVYQMLDCPNCSYTLTWEMFADGTWFGDIMPSEFCGLEPDDDDDDDDTVDDDTADDDATDDDMADDDVTDDDVTDDDAADDDVTDDDATDDDATDDDASITGDDDDDDNGSCGC